MSKVRITQIRSVIDRPEKQKRTVKALGLGKINRSVEKENNDSIAGMIRKVSHLIKVEEI
jgi:large subunit ribosomal protein L30